MANGRNLFAVEQPSNVNESGGRNLLAPQPQTQSLSPGQQSLELLQRAKGITPGPSIEEQQTLSVVARPILQAAGATGGAIVGAGAGLTAGPAAPVTSPTLGAIGSGLGFAIGDELADILDQFLGLRKSEGVVAELGEAGENIVTGAAFEAGGQLVGPVLKTTTKIPGVKPALRSAKRAFGKFTKAGATQEAGEVLAANTSNGPIIAKNIDEARALEEAIPGLKFSRGQLTDDPAVIKFERATARETGEFAAEQAQQTARNTEAIRNFVAKTKGVETIEDVGKTLSGQRQVIEKGVIEAGEGLEREAGRLREGITPVEAGQVIRGEVKAGEKVARKEAGELFEAVPEFNIDASRLVTKIDELSQPLNKFEDVGKNVPEDFGRIKTVLEESRGNATPQDLQGLRSNLTDILRDINNSAQPNKRMAKRVSGLIDEVDDVLKEASEGITTGQAIHKGKVISTEDLKKELSDITKKLQTEEHFGESVIDVEKTFTELQNSNQLGIMQQKGEGPKSYAERLGEIYNRKFKKPAPVKPPVERESIRFSKERKTEIQKTLEESIPIKEPEIQASAESLKTAQQFFKKEVIEKFRTGSVGDILQKGFKGDKVTNAQVASKFFKPGAQGEQAAQEFINAVGDNPKARQALTDFIKQDLLSTATNPTTGELTEAGLKRWLFRNKPALQKLGLQNEFDTVLKARQQLDDAIQVKTGFDKSAASKLLNADVDTAVKSAFASGPKGKSAIELLNRVKGDKKAVAGLQNSIIDHIIDTAETTAVDAFQNPIISVAGIEKTMKQFKPAIDIIFKDAPEKVKALNQVRNALRAIQRTSKSPLGGGSDTAENIITSIAKNAGFSASRIVNITNALIAPLKRMSDKQVNAIINRALIDPDFAFTIMNAAKGASPEVTGRRLTQHLATLGLVATDEKEQQ